MARPERNNVDYFPFLCKEGKAMYSIERKYGNDGYATWIKILRELAVTDFHFIDLNDDEQLMFLSAKCKVQEDTLINIINDLCRLKQLDKDLWEIKILFSQKFIDGIQDAYKKRINPCITRDGVLRLMSGEKPIKQVEPKKETKASENNPVKEHDLFPQVKQSTDSFFESLINGNEVFEIARVTQIPLETIKSKIEPFRKAADLEYTSYGKFVNHFKNWLLKSKDSLVVTSVKTTKLT